MWIRVNPNPAGKEVPDCVIRAICIALNKPWLEVSNELHMVANRDYSVSSDDNVWGHYLYILGFKPFLLPSTCPKCTTLNDFTKMYPYGIYIVGTGYHAVAVIDGNYYDSWDSGNVTPTFFWKITDWRKQ